MGTNNLTARTDGERIPASDHNELVQALLIDIVPRNNSRVPADLAGSLGTSALRFLRAYAQEFRVGDAANNIRIYEGAAGELWIERNSATDEIIKIREDSIEFWMSGNLILKFDETEMTAPATYLSHSSLKQNVNKKAGNFSFADTGNEYDTVWSQTLTDCKAGKKVLIDCSVTTIGNNGSNGNGDIRVRVGGTTIRERTDIWPNTFGASSPQDRVRSHRDVTIYTIPSDGDYTFFFQLSDTIDGLGTYVIEEF